MNPDVVALPLEEALEVLQQSGLSVDVIKTYATKPAALTDRWRVVRQTVKEGKIILAAAQECEGVAP